MTITTNDVTVSFKDFDFSVNSFGAKCTCYDENDEVCCYFIDVFPIYYVGGKSFIWMATTKEHVRFDKAYDDSEYHEI